MSDSFDFLRKHNILVKKENSIFAEICKHYNMSYADINMLDAIYDRNKITEPTVLAEELLIPKQTVTSMLDKLEKSKMIENSTRKNLVTNKLVLITHKKNNITADFSKKIDFASILKNEKLVIGAPESVPAGEYAKQAFTKLGYWSSLQKSIVTAANVRDALAFVSRGEALLGVVFATDAIADKNVKVVAEFPANTHDDISYPIAVIKENSGDEVKKLYNFLISDEAKKIYKKYGFGA